MRLAWHAGWIAVLMAGPALSERAGPAELPAADYAGQQYVDSKGCMFVRAGFDGATVWVPRVSREGTPVCGNPPSGVRVPVAEDIGIQPVPVKPASETPASVGGYFLAIGSFAEPENASRAEAGLAKLDVPAIRGTVQGANGPLITVFAGPFADAEAAEAAGTLLRENGFPDAMLIRP